MNILFLLLLFLFGFFLSLTVLQLAFMFRKIRMSIKEKKLLNNGVYPSGSEVKHGLVIANNKIISTTSKSSSWYRRLL